MDRVPSFVRAPGRSAFGRVRIRLGLALGVLCFIAGGCQGSLESRLDDARALQDIGQFRESIEPLNEILKTTPDNADANYLLGIALIETHDPSRAIYPLDRVVRTARGKLAADAGMLLTSAYLQTESYEDAARSADRVLALDPDRAQAVYIRGRANFSAGKKEEALIDADRAISMMPDDYSALLLRAAILQDLGRRDEAEQAYLRLKEIAATKDPSTAAKGWLSLITFYYSQKDFERTNQEFDAIVKVYPNEPLMLEYLSQFYDETGRSEEATALWHKAMQAVPDNLSYRVVVAGRLEGAGRGEEAERVLIEGTELFGSTDAWLRLAEFRDRAHNYAGAVEALEKTSELSGGGNDSLRFKIADVLINAGDRVKARELLSKIDDTSYRDLVEARLLFEDGDYARSLHKLDAAIRVWPNNSAARQLAAQAAIQLGDFERAATELRESFRADPEKSDAALALAGLEANRGRWAEAEAFADQHLARPAGRHAANAADALLIQARARSALGRPGLALKALEDIDPKGPYAARAVIERAAIERKTGGAKAAASAVLSSGLDLTDPSNEVALRTLAEDLVAQGDTKGALSRVDRALAAHAGVPALLDLRGRVLSRAGQTEAARAAFESALAASPEYAPALAGLAGLAQQQGDGTAALALLQRATKSSPDDTGIAYALAQLLLGAGSEDAAESLLRDIVRRDPGLPQARNDLAWILAEKGKDLDLALRVVKEAKTAMLTPDVLDTLGWVQLKRGEVADAVTSLEAAVTAGSSLPGTHYRLALALEKSGDRARAIEELQTALAAGAFPEADAARSELARLEQAAN